MEMQSSRASLPLLRAWLAKPALILLLDALLLIKAIIGCLVRLGLAGIACTEDAPTPLVAVSGPPPAVASRSASA